MLWWPFSGLCVGMSWATEWMLRMPLAKHSLFLGGVSPCHWLSLQIGKLRLQLSSVCWRATIPKYSYFSTGICGWCSHAQHHNGFLWIIPEQLFQGSYSCASQAWLEKRLGDNAEHTSYLVSDYQIVWMKFCHAESLLCWVAALSSCCSYGLGLNNILLLDPTWNRHCCLCCPSDYQAMLMQIVAHSVSGWQ